jgi:quercetin dioxygenase-like cupin family protein
MATLISAPSVIPAAGQPPKIVEEFFGRVSSQTSVISIAKMTSPARWSEPGQTPEFDEYTVVLRGALQVETGQGIHKLTAGQVILIKSGEWVRYGTPEPRARNILRCVCQRFHRKPFPATNSAPPALFLNDSIARLVQGVKDLNDFICRLVTGIAHNRAHIRILPFGMTGGIQVVLVDQNR